MHAAFPPHIIIYDLQGIKLLNTVLPILYLLNSASEKKMYILMIVQPELYKITEVKMLIHSRPKDRMSQICYPLYCENFYTLTVTLHYANFFPLSEA
jgi:hypothetical protein